MRFSRLKILVFCTIACCAMAAGCGTTKWTGTTRSATEQLLISDAMDRAVAKLDFRAVAGKTVYLDSSPLSEVTDSAYLVSLLRQHMLAAGCILKEGREEADYVVEVRAGAVGTDRREVVFGTPASQISGFLPLSGVPASIPEMPLASKTEQRAVAKIAVFAYNRNTGRPVWQSGIIPVESTAKNVWVLGAGPFERGTIFDGTSFAGNRIKIPLVSSGRKGDKERGLVSVTKEAFFSEPPEIEEKTAGEEQLADGPKPGAPSGGVIPAGHTAPVEPAPAGPPQQPPPQQPPPQQPPPQQPPPQTPPPVAPPPVAMPPLQIPEQLRLDDPAALRLMPRPPLDVPWPRSGFEPMPDVSVPVDLTAGFPELPHELPYELPYELRLDADGPLVPPLGDSH